VKFQAHPASKLDLKKLEKYYDVDDNLMVING
jgi:hypothetical protein